MKSLSGKEFAKLLENKGWQLARIHGSHCIYVKEGQIERISLPIHGKHNLKIGLLKHLLRVSGIDETEL